MRKTRAHDPVQGGLEARQDAGLTKREYFAAMAMQGICVNAGRNGHSSHEAEEIAKTATKVANALINALNESHE